VGTITRWCSVEKPSTCSAALSQSRFWAWCRRQKPIATPAANVVDFHSQYTLKTSIPKPSASGARMAAQIGAVMISQTVAVGRISSARRSSGDWATNACFIDSLLCAFRNRT
jgi:hypothetical protein